MRLEDIGFYTLSDDRAASSSEFSDLWRCELIVTNACNFRCPYCRGLKKEQRGQMSLESAADTIRWWGHYDLKNIRFSGGEPTLWPHLEQAVRLASGLGVERVAISTNGSAGIDEYDRLLSAGVNDFSISLDGACCSVGDKMAGKACQWDTVVKSIRFLSARTYVTAGLVFTEENIGQASEIVQFAAALGVSDIRVIPSAQYNAALSALSSLPDDLLSRFPILRYRIGQVNNGVHVRGIPDGEQWKCRLALDDMAVVKDMHYPCIIHLREGGEPTGNVGARMREDRARWVEQHDPQSDPICKKNCLDVCQDFNRRAACAHSG